MDDKVKRDREVLRNKIMDDLMDLIFERLDQEGILKDDEFMFCIFSVCTALLSRVLGVIHVSNGIHGVKTISSLFIEKRVHEYIEQYKHQVILHLNDRLDDNPLMKNWSDRELILNG